MAKRRTSLYWRELRAEGLRYKEFTIDQKSEEIYEDGKRLVIKWFDEARIQIGENYGNCIYTNKAGANMVYKAVRKGEIEIMTGVLDSFKTINAMRELLEGAGQKCKVGCC